ncbi:MAG: two-component regulator propeller domain-containing protein [Microscillaceae bacterium]|nr:two-component regulator propeller domain-containing protein [Microscillaceae bacterium]
MSKTLKSIVFFSSLCFCLHAQKATKIPAPHEATQLGLSPLKAISQYQCDQWNKTNGLPQNSVFSIIQSQEGYLWLGTYEGLVRFDGSEFKVYPGSLAQENWNGGIWSLFEDSKQQIWIGTLHAGLIQLKEGNFKTFDLSKGLPSNSITAITEDKDQRLWVGTRKGLCLYQKGTFKVFTTEDGLSSSDISSLYCGTDNTLWIGTSRGLCVYRNGKFEDYSRSRILFINKYITSICRDQFGQLWIGTHAGLVRWNEKKQAYKIFRTQDGLSDDYITKVFRDSRGTLWIGTQSEGINRLTEKQLVKDKPVFNFYSVREGLGANSVSEIYEDREGSLWIGLNRGGLNRFRDGKFTNFSKTEGLSDNVSNCVYEDSRGRIWIGTLSGGVNYLDKGKFYTLSRENGLSSNHIRSVAEDQEGNIWLASYGGGLNRVRFQENSQDFELTVYTTEDGLAGNIIRSLCVTRGGALLISTQSGLSKYAQGKFTNFTRQLGLSDNSVTGLLEDSQNNIWAGTDGGGLNCIRPDNNILHYHTGNGLANNLVYTLYEDKKGGLWIGTRRGLSYFKDGEMVALYARDGLIQEAIHSIVEDDKGRIWMSCHNGVFWIDKKALDLYIQYKLNPNKKTPPKPLICTLYQESDGMKSSDCAVLAQPSSLKDRQGKLWFPTTEGVARLDPAHIKVNYIIPQVAIKRIVVDNVEYSVYKPILLNPGKTKFEIDFTALSFIAPEKVKYRYRLIGSNYKEDWVESGNRPDAYYTNLPPGKYTFTVQAANNDGIWNEKGSTLSFYLRPYFYQTRWFLVLSTLLILSMGSGLYYWRIRSLERSKRALEKGIEESTQKIRTQYQEITQQAEELETINHIVTTINQEVKFENVLQALLEQGLLLFSKSNQGIFLLYDPAKDIFKLAASCGYDSNEISRTEFSREEIVRYCATGLQIERELFRLHPAINLHKLMPGYRPKSSLAMQITQNGALEGVIFFDNSSGNQDIHMSDIQKLTRFKEHAVAAFIKARILSELETKNLEVENSFKKISDSIRYARRIQKAILPKEEEIASFVEDMFIIYKPKDIVSGDFYWFAETTPEPIFTFGSQEGHQNNPSLFKGFQDIKKVIAAVDCTGHGVPGAFMTVIGNDLLNSIVIEDKIVKAHRILDQLDKQVKMYLKQDEGSKSKDGMDMALLVIDEINQTIEFAGAKNPLYYIREGELFHLKGSKYPIGGVQSKAKVFSSETIHYQPGDIFYLFSDGFQDQFGGPQDRKYGSKRFRELLFKTHQKPMDEQRDILEFELHKWKGNNKQTDDILVMGLKF